MAANATPKFHNTMGARQIAVGAKEFECIGAKPPFDHPHIFIDMGDASETVCPYCSTLYVHDGKLGSEEAVPAEARFTAEPAAT